MNLAPRVAAACFAALIVSSATVSAVNAQAHDGPPPSPTTMAKVRADLGIAGYVWLPSIGGRSGVDGTDISIDVSFIDIFEESDHVFGLMGQAELEINRFLVIIDPTWTRMEKDDAGPSGTNVDVTIDTVWFDVNAGYRFVDRAPLGGEGSGVRLSVDGLVGLRLTYFDVDLDGPGPGDASGGATWVDPLVGGRAQFEFGERLALSLRGDIGGFGVGSDVSAQMVGALGYRFPLGEMRATVFGGYRALYQDYESGDFDWRAWVHGPMLGVRLVF